MIKRIEELTFYIFFRNCPSIKLLDGLSVSVLGARSNIWENNTHTTYGRRYDLESFNKSWHKIPGIPEISKTIITAENTKAVLREESRSNDI